MADYEATFARLTAAEQATVTAALAGPRAADAVHRLPAARPRPGGGDRGGHARSGKIGSPYVWGATGPNGFDCSGLTILRLRRQVGVTLPRSSSEQSPRVGKAVGWNDLQPGDLVFYYSPVSHVGIYIGNGMIVHARTFGQPVAVTTRRPARLPLRQAHRLTGRSRSDLPFGRRAAGRTVPVSASATSVEHPPEATLRPDAIGFIDALVIGLAATSPAYSLAAVIGPIAALVGIYAPGVLLASFVPMVLIATAFYYLNRVDQDCGTTFCG